MPSREYRFLLLSLGLYVLMSPLGTYNTLALFGFVDSKFVPVQLSMTAVMIVFAILGSRTLGKHCLANPLLTKNQQWLWTAGFYVIGPPVLYAYYRLRFVPVYSVELPA